MTLKERRAAVKAAGIGTHPAGTDEFSYLMMVMKNHHNMEENLKTGIAALKVVPKQHGLQLQYVLCNGATFPLGYSKNSLFQGDVACVKNKVLSAMRYAIADQVQACRSTWIEKGRGACELCHRQDFLPHVDHQGIAFSQIADEFLAERPSSNWSKEDFYHEPTVRFADGKHEEWIRSWQIHHASAALLRVICRSCNCSKGAYGYKRAKRVHLG